MRLLAVNSYDKDAYVRRWIDDARELDPTQWRLQIINSGPTREFSDARTVPAANPSAIEGYRLSLSATVIDHDVDAIVSAHSKTYLTSLGLLDHVADRLPGHDAVFMERPPCFDDVGGGEHLFLFAVRADRWRELTEAISISETGLWNEAAMARAVDAIGLDVYRMSARHRRTPTEHNSTSNYWSRNVDGTRADVYGCEPGRTGFGHYLLDPEGYFSVRVDQAGRVSSD